MPRRKRSALASSENGKKSNEEESGPIEVDAEIRDAFS